MYSQSHSSVPYLSTGQGGQGEGSDGRLVGDVRQRIKGIGQGDLSLVF